MARPRTAQRGGEEWTRTPRDPTAAPPVCCCVSKTISCWDQGSIVLSQLLSVIRQSSRSDTRNIRRRWQMQREWEGNQKWQRRVNCLVRDVQRRANCQYGGVALLIFN